MKKLSRKEALDQVIAQYTTLRQALSDAEYWHKEYLKEIDRERSVKLATIDAELRQSITEAERQRDQAVSEATGRIADAKQKLGIIAEPWSSPLWKSHRPKPRTERQQRIHAVTGLPYETSTSPLRYLRIKTS